MPYAAADLTLAGVMWWLSGLQDAGGVLPNTATLLARGATPKTGQYSTVDYNFNSSVPAQMQNFTAILQEASADAQNHIQLFLCHAHS